MTREEHDKYLDKRVTIKSVNKLSYKRQGIVGELATTAVSQLSKSPSSVEVKNFYKYLTTEL